MKTGVIDEIHISGLRGIRTSLNLKLEGKNLILFGENGTGKSSIIDSIELSISGELQRLCGESITTKVYAKNINCDHYETELIYLDKSNSNNIASGNISQQIRQANINTYILRRSQILDFIDKRPAERKDILAPFLPVNEIFQFEEIGR